MIRTIPVTGTKGYGSSGASTTKRALKGFRAVSGSPHEDIDLNNYTLRQRGRLMYMGAPIATSAVKTSRTNIVGLGLQLNPRPDLEFLGLDPDKAEEWTKTVKREFSFRKWVKNLKGGKTFWKQVIVTTVFFLIVFGLTTALESFFPNLDTGMIMLKRDTPARLIAFAISTMFLPAITEESFYRKSIISFRSKPALVLSAVFGMLLYAAEHSLKPWGIFLTAIWALPLTISYIRTKNVYVPMTAHFIVNVFGNGVTVIMTIVAMCK